MEETLQVTQFQCPPLWSGIIMIPEFILLVSYCLTHKQVTSLPRVSCIPLPTKEFRPAKLSRSKSELLQITQLLVSGYFVFLHLIIVVDSSIHQPSWDKVWPIFQEQLEDQEVGTDGFSQSPLNQFQSVIFSHTPHAYHPSKK